MVRLVDIPLDAGDPNKAVTDIEAAITESRSQERTQEGTRQETQRQTQTNDLTDPRFAGKSTEEIVSMYRNLESHSGRLANQLGEARNSVNALILGKRENDLRQGSGNRETTKVNPADLMVDPTSALDTYFRERTNPEVSALKERLAQLEQQLTQTVFTVNHPKATDITQDPQFAAWVRQTPLRMQLADAAAQGNLVQADLLLKEWQHTQTAGTNSTTNTNSRAQELARSVSLESGSSGSEAGDGKGSKSTRTFSRRDLIALRQRDPEKYESQALQNEIVRAYVEGRVVD
jgi:hypothetical protein